MKKQTTIEWLAKLLEEYGSSSHLSLDWGTFDEFIQQAKSMEKQQIIDAYDKGEFDCGCNGEAEQYYNGEYKNEKTNGN